MRGKKKEGEGSIRTHEPGVMKPVLLINTRRRRCFGITLGCLRVIGNHPSKSGSDVVEENERMTVKVHHRTHVFFFPLA